MTKKLRIRIFHKPFTSNLCSRKTWWWRRYFFRSTIGSTPSSETQGLLVRGFGRKFFSLRGEEPWELFLTEPVPKVVELGSADFCRPKISHFLDQQLLWMNHPCQQANSSRKHFPSREITKHETCMGVTGRSQLMHQWSD